MLAEIRDEDVCGEDPLSETIATLLAAARPAEGEFKRWWAHAGELLPIPGMDGCVAAVPLPDGGFAARQLAAARFTLRDMEG